MHYIKETLSTNEEIHMLFELSWINYIKGYLFLAVALPLSLVILKYFNLLTLSVDGFFNLILTWVPIFVLVVPFFLWLKSIEQGVTNRRVVVKSGIISRDTLELRLEAVEKISVNQSVLGRMLDYGTVVVTGKGQASLDIKDVNSPIGVKRAIESAIELRERDFVRTV